MVTTLAKQRQKLSKYKLWRARFIILTLRQVKKQPCVAFFHLGEFGLNFIAYSLVLKSGLLRFCYILLRSQNIKS
jgi:hypothetical protein